MYSFDRVQTQSAILIWFVIEIPTGLVGLVPDRFMQAGSVSDPPNPLKSLFSHECFFFSKFHLNKLYIRIQRHKALLSDKKLFEYTLEYVGLVGSLIPERDDNKSHTK